MKLPKILARHKTLSTLIEQEMTRRQPRPGYLRGLAAPEQNAEVKRALLELARAWSETDQNDATSPVVQGGEG